MNRSVKTAIIAAILAVMAVVAVSLSIAAVSHHSAPSVVQTRVVHVTVHGQPMTCTESVDSAGNASLNNCNS